MSRAYRLLMLVQHIRRSSKLRARDLAERLDCTERQIFRDLQDLSGLGIPIYFDRDGYKLHSEGFLPPLSLSPEESLVLSLGLSSPAIARVPKLAKAAKTLLQKLKLEQAPVFLKHENGKIRILAPNRLDVNLSQKMYNKLSQAISRHQVLEIDYAAVEGLRIERIHPYALFFRRNHWYLAAWTERSEEVRLFRMDRVRACRVVKAQFKRDEHFDLETYLQSAWEMFPGNTLQAVVVRFSPALARVVTDTVRHPSQKISRERDGSVTWSVTVGNLDEVRWWLMGFGSGVEVLEPLSLRQRMAEEAEAVLALYRREI